MSKFKEGQEVWYFTTRNPNEHSDISELWDMFSIDDIYLNKTTYDGFNKHDDYMLYATKDEAIDALISRLENMRDRKEINPDDVQAYIG